jgi:hypothetical protein
MIKERSAQAALWLLHRALADRAAREGEPCLS